jgi:hypothetical protein
LPSGFAGDPAVRSSKSPGGLSIRLRSSSTGDTVDIRTRLEVRRRAPYPLAREQTNYRLPPASHVGERHIPALAKPLAPTGVWRLS